MSEIRPAPAPRDLASAGKALWKDVARQLADDGLELDARERRWLRDACAEADLIAVLEDGLKDAPLMVRGSQGQDVINPLISELRQHREALGRLLARLKTEDPDDVRSPGRGSRTTPTMARAAAHARHHGTPSLFG